MSLVMFMRIGGIALQLLWFVILVRLMPQESVGVYSVINSCWILVRALGPLGYDTAFIREGGALIARHDYAQATGLFRYGLKQAAKINILLYALAAGGMMLLNLFATEVSHATLIISLLGALAYLLFGFYSSAMLALEKQVAAHALESLVLPITIIGVTLALHFSDHLTLDTMILSQVGIAALIALAYHLLTHLNYGKSNDKISSERGREFSALARRMFGTLAFNNLNVRLPVIVSPLIIGTAGTALLEAAIRFASLLGVVQWCAAFVIAPKLSKVDASKEPQTLQNLLVVGCWLVFTPCLALFLALLFGGKLLLWLTAGELYLPAYGPMMVLALGYLVNTSSGPTTHFFMMLGHEKTAFRISASETVLTMLMLFALGHMMGIYGISLGMALGLAYRNFWLNYQLEPLTGLYSGVWSLRGCKHMLAVVRGHAAW